MPSLTFCLSLFALLFAPGPTNALLALSSAETGVARALRLVPVVMLAYAITVLPLAVLGADLLYQQHVVRSFVTLAAAAWVAWLAIALWRQPDEPTAVTGKARGLQLFITTLLNPKAFIIGLVLIPTQPSQVAANATFLAILAVAAAAWAMLGGTLRVQRSAEGLPLLRRACAGWLGLLAVMLGTAAFSA